MSVTCNRWLTKNNAYGCWRRLKNWLENLVHRQSVVAQNDCVLDGIFVVIRLACGLAFAHCEIVSSNLPCLFLECIDD